MIDEFIRSNQIWNKSHRTNLKKKTQLSFGLIDQWSRLNPFFIKFKYIDSETSNVVHSI